MDMDLLFKATLSMSLFILLIFMSGSIIGYVVQTSHCEDGLCKEFCRFSSDCSSGEVCCDSKGVGVCENKATCGKEFSFQPDGVDMESLPRMEAPAPVLRNNIVLYAILIFLAILIGALYLFMRKKK